MERLRRIVFVAAFVAPLVSCVVTVPQTRVVPMVNVFDASEVAYVHERGTNTIEGNAFMRQRGGGVVTCAGEGVLLIPAGEYARERMRIIFGTDERSAYTGRFGGQVPDDAGSVEYSDHLRSTQCDSEGRFEFDGVAAGSYFVWTQVEWTAGNSPQGGLLMAPVNFVDADRKEVLVSVTLKWLLFTSRPTATCG